MNTAFIGLDYIIDITHPEGKIARSAAQVASRGVIRKANQALATARSKGWTPILVKVGFSPEYWEQPKHSPMFGRAQELGALRLGGPGTAFHPDLAVIPSDLVIIKPRVSAFYGTMLDAVFRAQRIERLVIAGVSTPWAVQSTVRDAHDRDYDVIVAEDACAAGSEEEHQASVRLLAAIARIVSVDGMATL